MSDITVNTNPKSKYRSENNFFFFKKLFKRKKKSEIFDRVKNKYFLKKI